MAAPLLARLPPHRRASFVSVLLLLAIFFRMSRALWLHGSTSSRYRYSAFSRASQTIVAHPHHVVVGGFLGRSAGRAAGRRRAGTSISTFARRTPMTMMPEGPEVRTLADQLQPAVGRHLVRMEFVSGRYSTQKPPTGYHPNFFDRTVVSKWSCKGKFMYLLLQEQLPELTPPSNGTIRAAAQRDVGVDEDHQLSVWFTLGMTGKFLNEAAHRAVATEAREGSITTTHNSNHPARWFLELEDVHNNATSRIYYHDPRSFGTVTFCSSRTELATKLASLGPDVLSESFTEDDFVGILTSTRQSTNVCRFLMDQSKVSGIGNYLLAEGLYKASIDPFCSLEELNTTQQVDLFRALKETSLQSYEAQGMTRGSQGKYRTVSGDRGQFEFELCCYGRQRCRNRNDPVRHEVNGPHGRAIWYTDAQLFKPRTERSTLLSSVSSSEPGPGTRGTSSSEAKRKRPASGGSDANGGRHDPPPSSSTSADAVDWLLKGLVEPSWKSALADHLATPSFRQLAEFVDQQYRKSGPVYPPRQEIFAALNAVPVDGVRVVIVGQDPYHGPGQAHGLAFSVPKRVRAPPSLQNVLREVNDDLGTSDPPAHGCLTSWAQQGVLLLNTVLTVRAGEAFSHANKGWEEFTDAVLETVAARHSERGVVFLLWGNPAQAKARCVSTEESAHCIIKTSHPSPLGARKTASPFLGSRCFSRANAALIERHYDPIDWTLS